jgi:hypothetical protein
MAIVAVFEVSGATSAKYDEVIRRLTELGLRGPDRQMYHICDGDKQKLQFKSKLSPSKSQNGFQGQFSGRDGHH